ncbi:MAG: tyrosine-type recombinase/integrase [Steroidobacteraceae bacterium]
MLTRNGDLPRTTRRNGKRAHVTLELALAQALPDEATLLAGRDTPERRAMRVRAAKRLRGRHRLPRRRGRRDELDFDAIARAIEASPAAPVTQEERPRRREQLGSLRLIDGKRWQWRYREPKDAKGKRRRVARIIGTLAELPNEHAARAEAARLLPFVLSPRLAPGSSPPWRQVCARYLRVGVPLYRDGSREQLAYTLKNHLAPAFEMLRLHEVTAPEIQSFMAAQVRSGARRKTIKTRVGYLVTLLGWCQDRGLAAVVPPARARRLPRPREIEPTPEERGYQPAEEEILLTCSEFPWRAVYAIQSLAGLRVGETLALQWEHVRLPPEVEAREAVICVRQAAVKGRIAPPKSRLAVRDVPICPRLAAILAEFRERWTPCPSQLLFAGPSDAPRWSSGVTRHLDRLLVAHRIRKSRRACHAMRHSFSRHLHEAGTAMRVVQDLMGHGSLAAAAVYTERSRIDQQRAAIERALVAPVATPAPAAPEAAKRNDFAPARAEEIA